MRLITDFFGKYKITYDYANKILEIREKMPVKDFAKLKEPWKPKSLNKGFPNVKSFTSV